MRQPARRLARRHARPWPTPPWPDRASGGSRCAPHRRLPAALQSSPRARPLSARSPSKSRRPPAGTRRGRGLGRSLPQHGRRLHRLHAGHGWPEGRLRAGPLALCRSLACRALPPRPSPRLARRVRASCRFAVSSSHQWQPTRLPDRWRQRLHHSRSRHSSSPAYRPHRGELWRDQSTARPQQRQ